MLVNLDVKISLIMAVSIYSLSLLVGAASMLPGGIGATEIGMSWLLIQAGVESDVAIISSIISRLLTLLPAMLTGLICAFIIKISKV